jgi:hypothetical protein
MNTFWKKLRSHPKKSLLIGILLLFLMYSQASYLYCYLDARHEYDTSRSGVPGSEEFIKRGIRYGMNPQEVRAIMTSADKTSLGMTQVDPPWEGTCDLFIFRYGSSPWRGIFYLKSKVLYEELYTVYYDAEGRAVKIRRDMVRGPGKDMVIDLNK